MALVTTGGSSTQHEEAFIRFCQEVAQNNLTANWGKNIELFDRIFRKFKTHGKSDIPIKEFINVYRSTLEQPVLINSEANDKWLDFEETGGSASASMKKSMVPVEPHGVYLPMVAGEWKHSLPLSEVYRECTNIAESGRQTFSGVSSETLPAKFLLLMYNMFVEVEPDNSRLKENVELCDEMVTPATFVNPMSGIGDMGDIMGSIMSSDGARKIQDAVSSLGQTVDTDYITQQMQSGDFMGALNSCQPILANPAVQNMMTPLLQSPMFQNMMAMMAGASAAGDPSLNTGGDASDQE